MKKYVRVVDGKVDNIFESNNPITEDFPSDQFWVDASAFPNVDYSWVATNTDGVWTFKNGDPWNQPSQLSMQINGEKRNRFDRAYARLTSTSLLYKIELGLATAADEAYLLAHKQFCIDLTNVNKQPGFPLTVTWPELP